MTEQNISVVDITIGANMYGRISDLPNTPSHVLAEFETKKKFLIL